MDEADLARAMARGELASPQQYGNSWFFNLRISGTGGAYREAHDEYVWRDPAIYLNQHFLDRCSGLPVIIDHPAGEMLDSEEYHNRNVGSIVYPYIRGDEVWGIARIIDQPTARFMQEHPESTSPAVVFTRASGNERIDVGDGRHLLIEGEPKLLDHLAICDAGVWDKGGPPAGVDNAATKEVSMAHPDDENKDDKRDDKSRDDAHRDDADAGEKLDRLLDGIKVLSDRMDSIERDRRDSKRDDEDEEMSEADRVKKDAEEAREEEAKEKEAKEKEEREDKARRDRRDSKDRKDEDAETEARQAAELRKLAEEEEAEAAREEEDDSKKDRKDGHRDDAHRDDEEEKMPWDEGERKEGESDSAYARRMDAMAKKHDSRHAKRDDESTAAYCDRMAAAARRDRARKDAATRLAKIDAVVDSVSKLTSRLAGLERRYERAERPHEDEVLFADAQARADGVYMAHGDSAPRAMRGEGLTAYRVRLLGKMQRHSPVWKDTDLRLITADPRAFDNIERIIYADAATAARQPTASPRGTLRPFQTKLDSGHVATDFAGEPIAWMQSFMGQARCMTRLGVRQRN